MIKHFRRRRDEEIAASNSESIKAETAWLAARRHAEAAETLAKVMQHIETTLDVQTVNKT